MALTKDQWEKALGRPLSDEQFMKLASSSAGQDAEKKTKAKSDDAPGVNARAAKDYEGARITPGDEKRSPNAGKSESDKFGKGVAYPPVATTEYPPRYAMDGSVLPPPWASPAPKGFAGATATGKAEHSPDGVYTVHDGKGWVTPIAAAHPEATDAINKINPNAPHVPVQTSGVGAMVQPAQQPQPQHAAMVVPAGHVKTEDGVVPVPTASAGAALTGQQPAGQSFDDIVAYNRRRWGL